MSSSRLSQGEARRQQALIVTVTFAALWRPLRATDPCQCPGPGGHAAIDRSGSPASTNYVSLPHDECSMAITTWPASITGWLAQAVDVSCGPCDLAALRGRDRDDGGRTDLPCNSDVIRVSLRQNVMSHAATSSQLRYELDILPADEVRAGIRHLRPQRELRGRQGAVPRAADGDSLRAPGDARRRRASSRADDAHALRAALDARLAGRDPRASPTTAPTRICSSTSSA